MINSIIKGMLNMDYEKLFIGLSGVILGWALVQFKDWRRKRKILKCLDEELSDLQSELERTLHIYSRQLQIYALKGIEGRGPVPLSNHIFKNYYKDAVLELNKHQRISMQLIHTLVEDVNAGILEYYDLTKALKKKHLLEGTGSITERDGELWGSKVISEFKTVSKALWHIKFHLSKPDAPELLPYSHEHEQYLQYLENVNKKISEIIEAAKSLDREKFEKIYDPDDFAKQFI